PCPPCVPPRPPPPFFGKKLWGYFIPVPPKTGTRRSLQRIYVRSGYKVEPVVEAILLHPALYTGPRMVKPPAVSLAGLLRGLGRGVDTDSWTWLLSLAGQQLFYPPNVAGWADTPWLDPAPHPARRIVPPSAAASPAGRPCPRPPPASGSTSPSAPSRTRTPPGRSSSTRHWSRTRSASCSPRPPTPRPADVGLDRKRTR